MSLNAMRVRRVVRLALAVLAGLGAASGGSALAQIANYPPGGAKTPKWSDLPDWNGVWEHTGAGQRAARQPSPSYTEEYRAKSEAARQAKAEIDLTGKGNTPATSPRAGVMPGMMTMEFPMDVEINRREVAIWSPVTGQPREIYTDGRLHPVDPFPSTKGHSIGHWEGQTLVVDTCCVRADTPMLDGGVHSDAMHITERIWSPSKGVLEDAMVVEDSKAFIQPWTMTQTYLRRPDWEEVENDVSQNDRPLPVAGQHIAVTLSPAQLEELQKGAAAASPDPTESKPPAPNKPGS